jgi:serine/threonine-protein kinase
MDGPRSLQSTLAARPIHLLLELGQGGMGTVYLAVERGPAGFHKLKVVKRLRADLGADDQLAKMFLDEARLSARLIHPNIVQTNEVGFDGAHYFIEMEYVEGQSLDSLARRADREGGMPVPEALWILTQTLAGLHYAHELRDTSGAPLNVVHRDVSPHNVLVGYEGTVKLLDFGIAKAADSQFETQTGVVKGKTTYMAPEQAERRPVDRRADLFSVGVMLWQLLAERRLWEGLSDLDILARLRDGRIPRLADVRPSVPGRLDAICARALAGRPEDRYATAAELQADLEDYMEGAGVHANARRVARLMERIFSERRAAVQAEIDRQIRALEANPDTTQRDVPLLADAPGYDESNDSKELPRGASEATRNERPARQREPKLEQVGPSSETTEATEATTTARGVASHAPRTVGGSRPRALVMLTGLGVAVASLLVGLVAVRQWRSDKEDTATTAASASGPARCAHNADCLPGPDGGATRCRKDTGACVALATPDCHAVAAKRDAENDETLWFGAMFHLTGPYADEIGKPYERGVEVAWQDFERITNGVPSTGGAGRSTPIGLVVCDDYAHASEVAHHLVADVGVPAILGFGTSQELIELATSTFIPSDVLAISVMDGSPLISTIPHPQGTPRLVWRTTLAGRMLIEPLATLVPAIVEPSLRTRGVVRPGESMRIAVLRYDSVQGSSLSEILVKSLTFNGKSVVDNEHEFEEFVMASEAAPEKDAKLVDAMVRFAPHVVLREGGDGVVHRVIEPLEGAWPSSNQRGRPVYLSANNLGGPALDAAIAKAPDLRGRMFGAYGPLKTPTNRRFTMRYNEAEDEDKKTPYTMAPAASYDGFYALVFAAYWARLNGKGVTGASLSEGMAHLVPPAQQVEVGPEGILAGANTMRNEGRIDLVGASTDLDFDLASGDVQGDLVLQCMRPERRAGKLEAQEIGLRYDARTRKWTGKLECP